MSSLLKFSVGFHCFNLLVPSLSVASHVAVSAGPPRGNGSRRGVGPQKVRFASWNIGSLTGKSIELVKSLRRRKISIACVQETK